MKTFNINGEKILLIKEHGAGDGGIVLNYMVEESDGTFSNFRHWYSDPVLARQEYEASEEEDVRSRIVLARKIIRNEPINENEQPLTALKRKKTGSIVKGLVKG